MKKAFTKKVFQIIILKFVIHAWGMLVQSDPVKLPFY